MREKEPKKIAATKTTKKTNLFHQIYRLDCFLDP